MTNTELARKCICSRHFLKSSFHASGILRKDAVPKIFCRDNISDEATSTMREWDERDNRLSEMEKKLNQEKNTCNILRLKLWAKCKAMDRLKMKLSSGAISDTCSKKPIARKVTGTVLTFVMMLLFNVRFLLFLVKDVNGGLLKICIL